MIDLNQFAAQTPLDDPAPAGPLRDPVAIAAACRAQAEEEAGQGGGQAEEESRGFFAGLSFEQLRRNCDRYLNEAPPAPDWIFKNSLLSGVLGFVVGAQGTGKSRWLVQLGAAVATGFDGFLGGALIPAKKGRVLAVFAEEQDSALWRRVRAVFNAFCPIRAEADGQSGVALIPHPAEADFLENFIPVAASGQDLRLVETYGGGQRPSQNYFDLLALAKSIPGLVLILLDPHSRVYAGAENDNGEATAFSTLLERLATETGASVLVSAHMAKGVTKGPGGKFDLAAALHMDSFRGASAFSAAGKWQLNLVSLPGGIAKDQGLADHEHTRYIAGRVCKVNEAPEGVPFFMRRAPDGTLRYTEPEKTREQSQAEAEILEWILGKVRDHAAQGKEPLTVRDLGRFSAEWKEIPKASRQRVEDVARVAVLDEKLFAVIQENKSGRKTEYLSLTPEVPDASGEAPGEAPSFEPPEAPRSAQSVRALLISND